MRLVFGEDPVFRVFWSALLHRSCHSLEKTPLAILLKLENLHIAKKNLLIIVVQTHLVMISKIM